MFQVLHYVTFQVGDFHVVSFVLRETLLNDLRLREFMLCARIKNYNDQSIISIRQAVEIIFDLYLKC
jgi:hypothetical protein